MKLFEEEEELPRKMWRDCELMQCLLVNVPSLELRGWACVYQERRPSGLEVALVRRRLKEERACPHCGLPLKEDA